MEFFLIFNTFCFVTSEDHFHFKNINLRISNIDPHLLVTELVGLNHSDFDRFELNPWTWFRRAVMESPSQEEGSVGQSGQSLGWGQEHVELLRKKLGALVIKYPFYGNFYALGPPPASPFSSSPKRPIYPFFKCFSGYCQNQLYISQIRPAQSKFNICQR